MKNQSRLKKLKRQAKALYVAATNYGDLSCGQQLAEYIRPEITQARREFSIVWEKIKILDPNAPDDPFKKAQEEETGYV